jgi:hypothetical protein
VGWPPFEGDSQVARRRRLQPIIYVVAEEDSAKAIRIVGIEVQMNEPKSKLMPGLGQIAECSEIRALAEFVRV